MRSDAPHGSPWRRQAGPPRSLGGAHPHRPVFTHGGGMEHPPVLSRKGSVAHQALRPLQSRPCLLPMSVAQAQASKSPHPLSTAERRCAERGWPRESAHKAREALRTAPCRGLWAVAHAVGTCVRRRRLCRPPSSSRRPATQPLHPAPDSTRVAEAWALVRCATRRALLPRLTRARRACAWPRYRLRCSVVSWRDWYGPRVPAHPGDSPPPARRGAPRG